MPRRQPTAIRHFALACCILMAPSAQADAQQRASSSAVTPGKPIAAPTPVDTAQSVVSDSALDAKRPFYRKVVGFTGQFGDLYKAYQKMQERGRGDVPGCNYVSYLQMADEVFKTMGGFNKNIESLRDYKKKWRVGLPVTEYRALVTEVGKGLAIKETERAKADNLMDALDATCSVAAQAMQSQNMRRLAQLREDGVDGVVKMLQDEMGLRGMTSNRLRADSILINWTRLYYADGEATRGVRDSVSLVIAKIMRDNLTVSEELQDRLVVLDNELRRVKRDIFLTPKLDSATGVATCKGAATPIAITNNGGVMTVARATPQQAYRAARAAAPDPDSAATVCNATDYKRSLVLAARAKQLIAEAELIKLTADARTLYARASTLILEDAIRREQGTLRRNFVQTLHK